VKNGSLPSLLMLICNYMIQNLDSDSRANSNSCVKLLPITECFSFSFVEIILFKFTALSTDWTALFVQTILRFWRYRRDLYINDDFGGLLEVIFVSFFNIFVVF
jgi:hypothetical protein